MTAAANRSQLVGQVRSEFARFGDLSGLQIVMGTGEERVRRLWAIASELARAGKHDQSERWQDEARAVPIR